jgi:hypothetical protein
VSRVVREWSGIKIKQENDAERENSEFLARYAVFSVSGVLVGF